MTLNNSVIRGISYLISPEDSSVEAPKTETTAKLTDLQTVVLSAVKIVLWSTIAVIVPVILL